MSKTVLLERNLSEEGLVCDAFPAKVFEILFLLLQSPQLQQLLLPPLRRDQAGGGRGRQRGQQRDVLLLLQDAAKGRGQRRKELDGKLV